MDFIAMLTAGFTAFNKLADGITSLAEEIKRGNDNAWFQQSADTFKPLKSGSTTGEKDAAAKGIGDLIHKL